MPPTKEVVKLKKKTIIVLTYITSTDIHLLSNSCWDSKFLYEIKKLTNYIHRGGIFRTLSNMWWSLLVKIVNS